MSDFLDYSPFGTPTATKTRSWSGMDPFTRMETLDKLQSQVNLLPPVPQQKHPIIDALKPIGGFLQFVAGVLNVPSAMISGAALQIADKKPGFHAQEYLKSVFNFKDQVSWSDVIKTLAEQNPTQNAWDKKWVQIAAGLSLDILLDPLTYISFGAITKAFGKADAAKLAKGTHDLILKQLASKGDEAAAKIASTAYQDALSKALGKGIRFQVPFIKSTQRRIGKIHPLVQEMLDKYKSTGVLPVKEFAQKFAPQAKQVGRGFQGIRRATQVVGRAFNPYYNKPQPLVQSMYNMEGTIAGTSSDIAGGLTKGFKGVDEEAKKLMQIYLENPSEIMYKNPKVAAVARQKAIAITQFIEDLATRKGEPTYESFKKLRWANRKWKGEFLDVMKGMKKWQTAKEAGKNVPNVPLKGILANTKQYFDESSIHYLESVLTDTDVGYKDLTAFAGFKGERRSFTEAFRKQFKNLTDEQKNFLNARTDGARGLLNDWFKTEMEAGITYRYRQGYALGYKGTFDNSREVAAIGPSMATFQHQKKFQNTQEAIKYLSKQLIDQKYAKTPEEAYKLLKKGTTQFGKIIDTIDESLYLRGVEHVKAMSRKQFIDEAIQWGVKVEHAGGGLGFSPVENIPELAGYIFPDEYSKFIGRAMKTINSDEAIAAFLKLWDKSQGWWKLYCTSINPGFNMRNSQSNVFLGYLHQGVDFFNPKTHLISARAVWKKLMTKATKYDELLGKKVADPFLDQVYAHGKTIRELADFGSKRYLIRPEYQMLEAARAGNMKESVRFLKKFGRAINPIGTQNLAVKGGERFGSFIESQARFTDFLITFKKMGDMEAAAAETNKIMVNYQALTTLEREVMRRGIPFYCVPADTEILTNSGWKKYYELGKDENELALTYNLEGDFTEWQSIDALFVYDYEDTLVHVKNKYSDFRFTWNHKFPVEIRKTKVKGKWYGGDRRIVEYKDFNSIHDLICAAKMKDQESILSPRDAAILGWIVTDGYYRWRGNHLELMIYQSNRKYAKEIRKLLGEYLSSESEHPQTGVICFRINGVYREKIKNIFKGKEDLPKIVTQLSISALEAIYDAMIKAEGSINLVKKQIQFSQKEGFVLDAFQIICQLLGKPTNFHFNNDCYKGYIFYHTRMQARNLLTKQEYYKGVVWCPKTKNETWIMRQGKKIIISGNSWMKQNLVNQFIFVFTQPGRYAKIPKIANAFQKSVQDKLPDDLKPKYFKDLWMWQLPMVLPNGTPLFYNPNFPFQDLNKISMNPKEVFRTVLTSVSPFLKIPIEMIPKQGYDIFRQQPLEKYPGYRAPVPGILQFAARALVNKTPGVAEKLGLKEEKGTVTTNPKVAKLIENFAPFVNNYARALAATPNKENYDNIFQAVSYLAGVKVKPVDIPSARYYQFRSELQKRKQYWGQFK